MKTEIKVALIGGAAMIVAAILAGIFGLLGNTKSSQQEPKPAIATHQIPPSHLQQGGNHVDNVSAGGNVNIEQTSIGK